MPDSPKSQVSLDLKSAAILECLGSVFFAVTGGVGIIRGPVGPRVSKRGLGYVENLGDLGGLDCRCKLVLLETVNLISSERSVARYRPSWDCLADASVGFSAALMMRSASTSLTVPTPDLWH